MGDLNLLVLEVDGSLNNPRVVCAVIIWTAVLGFIGILSARCVRTKRALSMLLVAVFVLLALVTPRAQLSIAEALYIIASRGVTSVGFWGGPPVWIAPVVAGSAALGAWLWAAAKGLADDQRNGV